MGTVRCVTEEILYSGVEGQARAVASGEVSAVELVEASLARIDQVDPLVNAFTVVLGDRAREDAQACDEARARGDQLGALHGVPVAIKEENDVAGTVTTFGGSANRTPKLRDGEVTRLLRAAGAVVVGKTNMPEFGQWPFTESEAHGNTRNPWKPGHTPGGSSGGTAAAVAAGMVATGIGGDGGGSIRIPSAACGLFGLKPTRGRVSSAPHADLWGALGTVGPLTRSVVDSAIVYDVIRGNQPTDTYRIDEPAASFVEAARLQSAESQRKLRIGWSTRSPIRGIKPAPEHVRAVEETVALLEGLGHELVELDPRYPDATAAFVPQFVGGVRAEVDLVEHPERLERRTKQVMVVGRPIRSRMVAGAVRRGEKLAARVDEQIFGTVDVLLTPTLAARPPQIGVLDGASMLTAALKSQPMIAYTALWNVTGHPAAAVPAGFADDGLPTSIQLVGRRGGEATLFGLSAQVESVRPWADRRPPL